MNSIKYTTKIFKCQEKRFRPDLSIISTITISYISVNIDRESPLLAFKPL
jgi:hypothetical protein